MSSSSALPQSLWREIGRWLRENTAAAIRSAIFGAIFAFAANFLLLQLVFPYRDTFDGAGGAFSSLLTSSLFFGIVTTVLFGTIGYLRAVGPTRFFHDLKNVPTIVMGLFRADGAAVRVHLLWGAATSFIAMEIVTPLLGAAIAIGVLSMIPSIVGRVISNFLMRAWAWAFDLLAPSKRTTVDASTSVLVGMVGSAAALALGLYIENPLLKLGLALGTGGLAFLLGRTAPAVRTGATVFVAVAVGQLLLDLFHPFVAMAQEVRPTPGEMINPFAGAPAAFETATFVETSTDSVPPAMAGTLLAAPGFALGSVLAQMPASMASQFAQAAPMGQTNALPEKPSAPRPKAKLPERPVRDAKGAPDDAKKHTDTEDAESQTKAMEKAYEDLERVGEKLEHAGRSARELIEKEQVAFDLPERAIRGAAAVPGMRTREWLRELAPDRGGHLSISIDHARAVAEELRGLRDFGALPDERLATLMSNLKFKGPGETLWTIDLDTLGFRRLKDGAWVSSEPPPFLETVQAPRGRP